MAETTPPSFRDIQEAALLSVSWKDRSFAYTKSDEELLDRLAGYPTAIFQCLYQHLDLPVSSKILDALSAWPQENRPMYDSIETRRSIASGRITQSAIDHITDLFSYYIDITSPSQVITGEDNTLNDDGRLLYSLIENNYISLDHPVVKAIINTFSDPSLKLQSCPFFRYEAKIIASLPGLPDSKRTGLLKDLTPEPPGAPTFQLCSMGPASDSRDPKERTMEFFKGLVSGPYLPSDSAEILDFLNVSLPHMDQSDRLDLLGFTTNPCLLTAWLSLGPQYLTKELRQSLLTNPNRDVRIAAISHLTAPRSR